MEVDSMDIKMLADSYNIRISEYLRFCSEFEEWFDETFNKEFNDDY